MKQLTFAAIALGALLLASVTWGSPQTGKLSGLTVDPRGSEGPYIWWAVYHPHPALEMTQPLCACNLGQPVTAVQDQVELLNLQVGDRCVSWQGQQNQYSVIPATRDELGRDRRGLAFVFPVCWPNRPTPPPLMIRIAPSRPQAAAKGGGQP